MRRPVVHMLGRIDGGPVNVGREQFALCGQVGVAEARAEPGLYDLHDERGTTMRATTTIEIVTCKKCSNLLSLGRLQEKPREDHLGSEGRSARHARREVAQH